MADPLDSPPPFAPVQVTFGAQTRCGRLRTVNQDHYLIVRLGRHQETLMTSLPDDVIASHFEEYGYAMAVADGMGGAGTGQDASHLALATLVHLMRHFGKWSLRVDDVVARELMARVERYYRLIDATLKQPRHDKQAGTETTTLTATFGAGDELFFAHVGHSRAYLLRDGQLMRLTRDHTVGRHRPGLAMAPLIRVNESARDLAHILTDTLGMRGSQGPMIDIERFRLCDDDRVLVCTNGLTDMVSENLIAEILATENAPDDQCRSLVDLATSLGGVDDVTALVARYRLP